jgi:hypothetical protein
MTGRGSDSLPPGANERLRILRRHREQAPPIGQVRTAAEARGGAGAKRPIRA